MRRLTICATLAAVAWFPAYAGPNVGVSIDINQPGVYGRIDISNMPPPSVVYAQPVVIAPAPVAVYRQPIYLYVPPAHHADWGRYCGNYAACGQPVYFVQEAWVKERYYHENGDREDEDRDSRHQKKRGHGHRHDD
ncbi:MAG TPA: hypothetical protein VFK10_12895 [Burkholderiaceae bacterium]|nr:hypothetical protein [Burkholderiaceae bacterium]